MVEQLSLSGLSQTQAYGLVDAVMDSDGLALTASAHEKPGSIEWVFEAACEGEPDLDVFQALARSILGQDVSFAGEELDAGVNWVARSLEGLRPVVAGGFYVYGSHETSPLPPGLTALKIDAAEAFGTGHHETTAGCLEAINDELKRGKPRSIIDIGSGTGVLAIGLAKRTRTKVIASDIDPVAVKTARENAAINGVSRLIVAVQAAGLEHRVIAKAGPYDFIIANILAAPLVSLAPKMGRVAARGATIILSGILDHQAPRVIAAYAGQGMVLRRKLLKKEWATLVLTKR